MKTLRIVFSLALAFLAKVEVTHCGGFLYLPDPCLDLCFVPPASSCLPECLLPCSLPCPPPCFLPAPPCPVPYLEPQCVPFPKLIPATLSPLPCFSIPPLCSTCTPPYPPPCPLPCLASPCVPPPKFIPATLSPLPCFSIPQLCLPCPLSCPPCQPPLYYF
ncbi:hypothetical protein QTP88_017309 [Uroleucon formosanum]